MAQYHNISMEHVQKTLGCVSDLQSPAPDYSRIVHVASVRDAAFAAIVWIRGGSVRSGPSRLRYRDATRFVFIAIQLISRVTGLRGWRRGFTSTLASRRRVWNAAGLKTARPWRQ